VPIPSHTLVRVGAFAGVGCISFAAIFFRLADAAPVTAVFFRASYALPVLAVAYLVVRRRDPRPLRARALAATAGLVLSVDLALWHVAIENIGAGLGTVLAATQVLFVAGLAWVLHRERPTTTALLTIPIILGGIVLLSGLGRADAYGKNPLLGVVFGVGTGLTYATFLLVMRASNRAHLAPSAGPVFDATLGTAVGGLLMGLTLPVDFDFAVSWPSHGWLLALGLVAQAAGWLLITVALPRLPALETSVLVLLQPVGAILWAYLIFAEALSPIQWLGVALVLGGVLFLSGRGMVRSGPPEPTRPVPSSVG
jgi:drug/metabolite transporter (DMT)-like permease